MNSLTIFKINNVPVKIHFTLIILGVVYLLQGYLAFLTFLTIFGFVSLHELGHVLMAKRFNIKTESITLLFLGGIADIDADDLEKCSTKEKLLIFFAGPAINIITALFTFIFAITTFIFGGMELDFLVFMFGFISLFIGLFNLLPVYPLDGGRILDVVLRKFFKGTTVSIILGLISIMLIVPFLYFAPTIINIIVLGIILIVNIGNIIIEFEKPKRNKIINEIQEMVKKLSTIDGFDKDSNIKLMESSSYSNSTITQLNEIKDVLRQLLAKVFKDENV